MATKKTTAAPKTPKAPKAKAPRKPKNGQTAAAVPLVAPGDAPHDHIQKITEVEGLRFSAMDTEMRNALQGIKLLEQEIQLKDIEHKRAQDTRQLQILQLKSQVASKESEYKNLVTSLATKYQLDPTKLSIDPETYTIHDLRDEKAPN